MRSRSSRFVHREKRPIAPIHLPPEAPPRVPRPTRQSSSPAAPPRRDRSRPAMPYSGVAYAYGDRKSTRLNSSHGSISDAVFCWKKKKNVLPCPTILTQLINHKPKLCYTDKV